MPDINNDLENFNLANSHYGFSGTRVDELDASEYTLVTLLVDKSGSTSSFRDGLREVAVKVLDACKKSPRADNLMLRFCEFSDDLKEVHGFRKLSTIKPEEYDCLLSTDGGLTALFDASVNVIEATDTYAKSLTDQEFDVNGILFIVTDGMNNRGAATENSVKKSLASTIRNENLESLVSILVGVNLDQMTDAYLQDFYSKAGLSQYVNIGDATPGNLAKFANFVSKSTSVVSQSIGSGDVSGSLTF